ASRRRRPLRLGLAARALAQVERDRLRTFETRYECLGQSGNAVPFTAIRSHVLIYSPTSEIRRRARAFPVHPERRRAERAGVEGPFDSASAAVRPPLRSGRTVGVEGEARAKERSKCSDRLVSAHATGLLPSPMRLPVAE